MQSEAEASMSAAAGQADFEYNQIEKETVEDLIASGQVRREHFEMARQQHISNRHVNIGYAFVTFSHADEAKQMLMLLRGDMFIGNNLVQVMAKGKLDHSELDRTYFMRKLKNDSETADYVAELREAKSKLREFEGSIDKEMPRLERLKEFKSVAREILEDPKFRTRRHESLRRTKREQEELNRKMRAIQKKHPDLDITQLFESEKTERARREMHKRAFQSYKKFEFLKAGILEPE